MKTLLQNMLLLLMLGAFSTSAGAVTMVWGESNWGEADWASESRNVPRPSDPIPASQKVRTVTGASTDAEISAGAYADTGSPVYGNTFTTSDYITFVADIYPDSGDVGTNGELVVVLLSILGTGLQWSFLDTDGNFNAWDLQLNTLGPAEIVQPLEEMHSLRIFEGSLQPGRHRMAVGYLTAAGQLIYTAKAINIVVTD